MFQICFQTQEYHSKTLFFFEQITQKHLTPGLYIFLKIHIFLSLKLHNEWKTKMFKYGRDPEIRVSCMTKMLKTRRATRLKAHVGCLVGAGVNQLLDFQNIALVRF